MASDLDAAPAAALHAQGRDLLLGALANPGVLGSTNAATSTSTVVRASAAGPVDDLLASAADAGASAAAFAHEVHWEGYVRKKGDWLPRWEERYLILDGAALTYYNSKDEARSGRNLRGRMQLSRVRPENYGKAHGFLIETRGHKSFHLCCTTELEKDMWVEMMQAAIDDHDAAHGNAVLTSRHRGVSAGSIDLGSATSSAAGGSVGGTVAPSPPPTQVDLRSFYFAFRQLLISHSSSPQFFPKLARDVVLSSNYAPTVPFWGEYHGLDGVLHFFSILYETVELTAFFVTDIAQAQEGSTAVVAGRETMKNRDNGRKFTQQWQHTIEFAPDGRVKSLTITADPVAASAVFGCNATSSLSLPTVAAVGAGGGSYSTSAGASNASHADNPAGTLRVVVFRGEQISNRNAYAGTDDDDEASYDSGTEDDDGEGDAATAGGDAATDEEHPHRHPHGSSRVFLGLRLLTDGKTNVYAPTSSAGCLARTPACDASQVPDPKWNSTHDLPFAGLARGKPCFMLIEAWQVRENPATPGADAEEIIGVAKVNLAPFLALASSSRTVRESVIHTDIARGAVPQWYTLLSAHETKFTCGRVQLSISFEAAKTGHHGNGHGATVNGGVKSASEIAADPNAPSQQIHAGSGNGTSSVAVAVPAPSAFSSQRVALARGHSFRDTKRDNHQFRVGNTNFDVPRRYQMIKAVGQGAYGCVIAASDTETGQALAIKNIPNAFNDLIDAKRILREIRLMRHLNHPNLVNLLDLIRPPSLQEFNDVYIVSELMETDLHRVIHSNQSISDDHIQYFLYQMLLAIHYVHSAQVLHRDLKPSNVLVNSDCDLKLCDFGLARGVHGLDSGLTEYVVTRWYRAPELLLSSKYDKQMDVWAIGCILAEMLGRRPLFPGHDYLHQLKIIMDVIGSPAEDSLDFITNPKAKRFILRQPKKPKVPLASVYPRATPQCLDLLDKMLVFDPRKRITIAEALEHPYLSLVRDKSLERTCPTPFDFAFENTELTKQKLQELIFEDVCAFHPDARIPDQGLTQSPPGSVGSSSSRFIGSASSSANGSARPVVSASNGSAASVPVAAPVRVQPAQVSATSAVAPAVSAESSAETRPAPVVLLPPNSVASSSAPASAAPAPVSAASAPVSAVSAAPPAPVVLLSPSTLPAVAATTSSESAPVSATATSTAAVAPQPTVQRTTSPLNEVALDIRDSVAETPRALGSAATPSPPASASVVAPALTLAPVLTLAPTPSREPAEDMSDAAMDAALEAIGSAGIHNVAVSSTASSAPPAVVKDEAQPATDEATTNGSSSADSSRVDPTEATGRHESSAGAEIDLAASPTKRLLHPPHAAALTPSSVV